jgi:hypothetical protein
MNYEERDKQLRRILTIDGKGQKIKAQFLLGLLNSESLQDIIVNLEEISGKSQNQVDN